MECLTRSSSETKAGPWAKASCSQASANREASKLSPQRSADRCGLSLDASRFAEACEQDAFAQGPAFVSDELLVKHSNEYRLADEDVEDVSELYAPVEGL